jgi:ribulose-phosphate 3-epimerase
MKQSYQISPSILSADFARLGEESKSVLESGADRIHFDVMDNHYVPNLTVGAMVCKSLRNYGIAAPIDVHLMVQPVDRLIEDFAKAGASCIVFHPEASEDFDKSIDLIKSFGCEAGLAFNPDISIDHLEEILPKIDRVLLMSVYPGFGGQKFIDSVLIKAKKVRKMIDDLGKEIRLEIDGGVNVENISNIAASGVDTFVAGSAIFKQKNYKKIIDEMKSRIKL